MPQSGDWTRNLGVCPDQNQTGDHLVPGTMLNPLSNTGRAEHIFYPWNIWDRFEVRRGSLYTYTQVLKFPFIFSQSYRNSLLMWDGRNRTACLGMMFPWLPGSVMEAQWLVELKVHYGPARIEKTWIHIHCYPFILRVYCIILGEFLLCISL